MELEGGGGICQITHRHLSAIVMEVGNSSSFFSLLAMLAGGLIFLSASLRSQFLMSRPVASRVLKESFKVLKNSLLT